MSINIRYPNLTGKTPAEQFAQIKSGIHQLVDQLNWAFSTISGGDHVTMRGTTEDGWIWKKWNSGDSELWAKFTIVINRDCEALGAAYLVDSFTAKMPFAVTNAVVCSTADKAFPLTIDQTGNTVMLRLVSPTPIEKGEKITLSLHIRGRS